MKIPDSLTEQLRRLGYEAISRARLEALMSAARVLISMDHDHDDDVHQNECPWCKSLAAIRDAGIQKPPRQIPPSNLIEGLSAIRQALIYDLPLAEIDWMGYLAEAISRLKQEPPTESEVMPDEAAGRDLSASRTSSTYDTRPPSATGAAVPEDIAGLIGEADREVFNEYFDRDKLNSLVKRLVAALRSLAQENERLTNGNEQLKEMAEHFNGLNEFANQRVRELEGQRDTMMKCVIELKAARDNQP